MGALLKAGPVAKLGQRWVDSRPAGPNADMRARGRSRLWGAVTAGQGNLCVSRLVAPEGDTLTATAAVDIARRVAAGEGGVGFRTPSLAFGADYVLGLPGVTREDVA